MESFLVQLYRSIGKNIQRLREEKNQTQKEFAQLCGLSRSQILRAEAGRGEIRLPTLARIAERTETPLVELLKEQMNFIHFTIFGPGPDLELKPAWSMKIVKIASQHFCEIENQKEDFCLVLSLRGPIHFYSSFQNICIEEKQGCIISGAGVTRLQNHTHGPCEALILRKSHHVT